MAALGPIFYENEASVFNTRGLSQIPRETIRENLYFFVAAIVRWT